MHMVLEDVRIEFYVITHCEEKRSESTQSRLRRVKKNAYLTFSGSIAAKSKFRTCYTNGRALTRKAEKVDNFFMVTRTEENRSRFSQEHALWLRTLIRMLIKETKTPSSKGNYSYFKCGRLEKVKVGCYLFSCLALFSLYRKRLQSGWGHLLRAFLFCFCRFFLGLKILCRFPSKSYIFTVYFIFCKGISTISLGTLKLTIS